MIKSYTDIQFLLEKYMDLQHDWNWHWEKDDDKWPIERVDKYINGIVFGCFREGDPLTLQTLECGVEDDALKQEILKYLGYWASVRTTDQLEKQNVEHYKDMLKQLRQLPIDLWIKDNYGWLERESTKLTDSEKKVLLFLHYAFQNVQNMQNNPYNTDIKYLKKVYASVFDRQSQFSKYGIVPINQDREIMPLNPPRIYDSALDRTFFVKNVSRDLLEIMSSMLDDGKIGSLSLRLLNDPGYQGKISDEAISEAFVFGKKFNMTRLGKCSVNKLCSETLAENCLWVIVDQNDMTFEELCEDFNIYNDMIVTQVIHLQYEKCGDDVYITHLDHEYKVQ